MRRKYLTNREIRAISKLLFGDQRCRPENRMGLLTPRCAQQEAYTPTASYHFTPEETHEVVSGALDTLTNPALETTRKKIQEVLDRKVKIYFTINNRIKNLQKFKGRNFGIPFFFHSLIPSKSFTQTLKNLKFQIAEAREAYEKCVLNLRCQLNQEQENRWNALRGVFAQDEVVWDITADHEPTEAFGEYGRHVISNFTRCEISFGESELDVLKCETKALFLENANGANFFFYPNFVIMEQNNSVAVLSPQELQISCARVNVLENHLPEGAFACDQVWVRAKKNGERDLRYKDNAAVPVAEYVRLNLDTAKGVHESYLFGRIPFGESFVQALCLYCSNFK